MGNDIKLPLYGAAFAFTALGAAAAVIGVYLLANSDTKAVARCIALALACGLAWKPVIDAGSALVTQTTDQENNEDVAKRTEDLQSMVTGLSTTKDLPATLVEMEQKAARIVRLLPKVTDAEVRADAEDSIRALVAGIERVMPQRPRESVSVLTRLAVAGLETRQPQFAPMVLGALHDVGIAAEDPAVSSSAFGGLEQIASAADTRPEAALAAEARYLGAEVVVGAATRAEASGRAETVAQLPAAEALRSLESAQRSFEARGDQARAGRATARASELEKLTKRPPGLP